MAAPERKDFSSPDETQPFQGKGLWEVVQVGGRTVRRATLEPGWIWSVNVRPIVDTNSCQASHLGFVLSGRMRVIMDDGPEMEVGIGDVFAIPRGHDAEVIGDEPCVLIEFGEI